MTEPARADSAVVDIVDRIDQVTPAWLTAALRAAGHDAEVIAITTKAIGTGQMGTSHRLSLRYAGDQGALPDSLVVKLPSADESKRAMVAGIYRTEVDFYRELAPTLAVRTPACHHAGLSDDWCRFVLLLEDLAPAVQGDQIRGCSPAEARDAVVNLAGLHGPRWCDETLADVAWISTLDAEGAEMLGEVTTDATGRFLQRYGHRLADGDQALLESLPEVLPAWIMGRAERFAPLHGDYRLDNLMFGPAGDPVAAVDWQTVTLGLPARDLAYFLGTGLVPDDRRAHEHELVAAYHEALLGHGVEGHSLEQCFDDYRYGMLQGPLITIVGAAYGEPSERGDAMFVAMATRSCQAIRDLATLDLL